MATITFKNIDGGLSTELIDCYDPKMKLFFTKKTNRSKKTLSIIHNDYVVEINGEDFVLMKTGYIKECKINSDEFDGLCQAAQIGENPFECTILSR